MSRGIPVMHIISGLPVGGAQTMLIELLRVTDRERWAPVVVSLRDRGDVGDQIESLGVPLCTLGVYGPLPHLAAVWRLRRHVRRFQPRLIQGWMPHGNLAALVARGLFRRQPPVVWNVRNMLVKEQKRLTNAVTRLGGALSGRADRIVYNSRRVADQFERLGYAGDRSVGQSPAVLFS